MAIRLIPLIAGLLYPLGFAPYSLWPAVIASIALFWWTIAQVSPREALIRGWLYGVGLFGFGVSWVHVSMHDYGYTPLWLAIPLTAFFACFLAIFPALVAWLTRRWASASGAAMMFCGLWLLGDVLRGWLLTGFPWLYAGYAMTDTWLAGVAPLGGIWLVTLGTTLTGVALGQLVIGWQRAAPVCLLALVCWGLAAGEARWSSVKPAGPAQPIALVQGNIPQDLRWQLYMRAATRTLYEELTQRIPAGHLVIWPEAAIPQFHHEVREYLEDIGDDLRARGSAFITGIPWQAPGPRYHNSVMVIADGEGLYHKQKLVPFGEYVPLQSLLRGLIPFFDLPMSSFTAGSPDQPNLLAHGMVVAPFICYEIVYPELVARRSADSNLLLTISNDAWFGQSAGPHQHFDMTRLRARETGRWLVRGTNNGITAIVNPRGQVVSRLPQFERDILLGSVVPMTGNTLYMRSGGWPVWLFSLVLVFTGIRRSHKTHN